MSTPNADSVVCPSPRNCERPALVAAARHLMDVLPHDLAVMWVRGRDQDECEAIDSAYDALRALVERDYTLPNDLTLTLRRPAHIDGSGS